jgi:hypothetical protein
VEEFVDERTDIHKHNLLVCLYYKGSFSERKLGEEAGSTFITGKYKITQIFHEDV